MQNFGQQKHGFDRPEAIGDEPPRAFRDTPANNARWKGMTGYSGFPDEAVRDFHQERADCEGITRDEAKRRNHAEAYGAQAADDAAAQVMGAVFPGGTGGNIRGGLDHEHYWSRRVYHDLRLGEYRACRRSGCGALLSLPTLLDPGAPLVPPHEHNWFPMGSTHHGCVFPGCGATQAREEGTAPNVGVNHD